MLSLFTLFLSILILYYGGNKLVVYASSLASRLNVNSMVIGIVIIGLGTSLPEIFVTSNAIRYESPDIALGTIIGSNISNIFLVLGLSLLLFKNNVFENISRKNGDLIFMILITIIFSLILEIYGLISLSTAIIMILIVPVYFYVSYKFFNTNDQDYSLDKGYSYLKITVNIIMGFILLFIGSEIFVYSLKDFSIDYGIPESIVGLSIAAVGTSLPEIAVTISSAINKQERMLLGNLIGSNIINILGALGVASILNNSIEIPKDSSDIHLYIICLSALWLFLIADLNMGVRKRRMIGLVSILIYISYIYYIYQIY